MGSYVTDQQVKVYRARKLQAWAEREAGSGTGYPTDIPPIVARAIRDRWEARDRRTGYICADCGEPIPDDDLAEVCDVRAGEAGNRPARIIHASCMTAHDVQA